MTDPTPITTADLLDEYAQALRGSWGDIDGRSEKRALNDLSAAIREYGSAALPAALVSALRDTLGVCPRGGGHWTYYCEYYDEELSGD